MKYKKITAIIRSESLDRVKKALKKRNAPDITLTKVKSIVEKMKIPSEYVNLFRSDCGSKVQIELYVQENEVDGLVKCIMEIAHAGLAGDGIITVMPVDMAYQIRTEKEELSS